MKQSWDGNESATTDLKIVSPNYTGQAVRVVPWTCPYPQEDVPQVEEEVDVRGLSYTIKTTPYLDGKSWLVRATHGHNASRYLYVKNILKKPAPTIEVAGKHYIESEVEELVPRELTPVETSQ